MEKGITGVVNVGVLWFWRDEEFDGSFDRNCLGQSKAVRSADIRPRIGGWDLKILQAIPPVLSFL